MRKGQTVYCSTTVSWR